MKENKSMKKVLLTIVIGCFLAAGLVMLGICIFSENESQALLPAALGCTVIANVLNLIRNRLVPKKDTTIQPSEYSRKN